MLEQAQATITALKNAKDAASVKEALSSVSGADDAEVQFEALLDDVKAARPKQASAAVFKHILLDYFDKSWTIDWQNDRGEFETAIQY